MGQRYAGGVTVDRGGPPPWFTTSTRKMAARRGRRRVAATGGRAIPRRLGRTHLTLAPRPPRSDAARQPDWRTSLERRSHQRWSLASARRWRPRRGRLHSPDVRPDGERRPSARRDRRSLGVDATPARVVGRSRRQGAAVRSRTLRRRRRSPRGGPSRWTPSTCPMAIARAPVLVGQVDAASRLQRHALLDASPRATRRSTSTGLQDLSAEVDEAHGEGVVREAGDGAARTSCLLRPRPIHQPHAVRVDRSAPRRPVRGRRASATAPAALTAYVRSAWVVAPLDDHHRARSATRRRPCTEPPSPPSPCSGDGNPLGTRRTPVSRSISRQPGVAEHQEAPTAPGPRPWSRGGSCWWWSWTPSVVGAPSVVAVASLVSGVARSVARGRQSLSSTRPPATRSTDAGRRPRWPTGGEPHLRGPVRAPPRLHRGASPGNSSSEVFGSPCATAQASDRSRVAVHVVAHGRPVEPDRLPGAPGRMTTTRRPATSASSADVSGATPATA